MSRSKLFVGIATVSIVAIGVAAYVCHPHFSAEPKLDLSGSWRVEEVRHDEFGGVISRDEIAASVVIANDQLTFIEGGEVATCLDHRSFEIQKDRMSFAPVALSAETDCADELSIVQTSENKVELYDHNNHMFLVMTKLAAEI